MAIMHLAVRPQGRAQGKSAAGVLCYRTGCNLVNIRSGRMNRGEERSGRGDILHTGRAGFDGIHPFWLQSGLQEVADRIELSEKHRRACLGRDVVAALPCELSLQHQIELAEFLAVWLATRYGTAVFYAVHRPDPTGDKRNVHVHCYLLDRRVRDDGMLGEKVKELRWDGGSGARELVAMRTEWARMVNGALAEAGHDARVTAERTRPAHDPAIHMGPEQMAKERREQEAAGIAPNGKGVLDRVGTHSTPKAKAAAAAIRRQRVRQAATPEAFAPEGRLPRGRARRIRPGTARQKLDSIREDAQALEQELIAIQHEIAEREAEYPEQTHELRTRLDRQSKGRRSREDRAAERGSRKRKRRKSSTPVAGVAAHSADSSEPATDPASPSGNDEETPVSITRPMPEMPLREDQEKNREHPGTPPAATHPADERDSGSSCPIAAAHPHETDEEMQREGQRLDDTLVQTQYFELEQVLETNEHVTAALREEEFAIEEDAHAAAMHQLEPEMSAIQDDGYRATAWDLDESLALWEEQIESGEIILKWDPDDHLAELPPIEDEFPGAVQEPYVGLMADTDLPPYSVEDEHDSEAPPSLDPFTDTIGLANSGDDDIDAGTSIVLATGPEANETGSPLSFDADEHSDRTSQIVDDGALVPAPDATVELISTVGDLDNASADLINAGKHVSDDAGAPLLPDINREKIEKEVVVMVNGMLARIAEESDDGFDRSPDCEMIKRVDQSVRFHLYGSNQHASLADELHAASRRRVEGGEEQETDLWMRWTPEARIHAPVKTHRMATTAARKFISYWEPRNRSGEPIPRKRTFADWVADSIAVIATIIAAAVVDEIEDWRRERHLERLQKKTSRARRTGRGD